MSPYANFAPVHRHVPRRIYIYISTHESTTKQHSKILCDLEKRNFPETCFHYGISWSYSPHSRYPLHRQNYPTVAWVPPLTNFLLFLISLSQATRPLPTTTLGRHCHLSTRHTTSISSSTIPIEALARSSNGTGTPGNGTRRVSHLNSVNTWLTFVLKADLSSFSLLENRVRKVNYIFSPLWTLTTHSKGI